MKKLIINADEFGLTEGTNRAIIEAYKFGTVTSTTMIANMWAFEDSVRLVKENPDLAVGIHLNLTDGMPVSCPSDVRTLLNKDGLFYNRRGLIQKLLLGKINLGEIRREFNSQLFKLITNGIHPSHIDTHQVIILIPTIFWIMKDLVKELRIPVLLPADETIPIPLKTNRWIKRLYSYFIGMKYRRIFKEERITIPDHFYKVTDFFRKRYWDERRLLWGYQKVISSIKEGVSQLMVHPSYMCDNLIIFMKGSFTMAKQREEELKLLLNPQFKSLLYKSEIKLINYKSLKP